jgi:hypothetical protein
MPLGERRGGEGHVGAGCEALKLFTGIDHLLKLEELTNLVLH